MADKKKPMLREGVKYTIVPPEGRAYVNFTCTGVYETQDGRLMHILSNERGQYDFSSEYLSKCQIFL